MKKLISLSKKSSPKIATIIFLLSCQGFATAQAATLDDVVASINAFRADVVSKLQEFKDLMFQFNPNQPFTVIANAQQGPAIANTDITASSQMQNAVIQTLVNRSNKETFRLANLPASDLFLLPRTGFSFTPPNLNLDAGNNAMNFSSLIGPVAYTNFNFKNLSSNPQYNYIQFVSGNYQPVSTISLTDAEPKLKPEQIQQIENSNDYRKYRAAIRAYVAAQSVGMSNLYQLMAERIPQQDLGAAAGMPTRDVSQLQLNQYLASRRNQNPDWYKQMATASPATVQRETLFVLAEIRQQLFTMQQQNERLLATISVMQMQQNTQGAKLNLITMEQKIQTQIKQAQGISDTEVSPSELKIPGTD